MDNKDFIDLTNGEPDKGGQHHSEYPPADNRREFRIDAAIQPKTFNKIVIAVAAGSAALTLFVVIKLILLFAALF